METVYDFDGLREENISSPASEGPYAMKPFARQEGEEGVVGRAGSSTIVEALPMQCCGINSCDRGERDFR